ncbi:YvcK family protein [Bacillaceae bacterium S4-13-58]
MTKKEVPRIVVIGGGTGLPVLLRGLKNYPIDITALVTVADDGGSSGRLRDEMEIPAPGDIRNVIASLSTAEPMILELFQHRFKNGNGLSGHSLGNLLLAAMTAITGDFYNGIKEISRVLNVKGTILPIANQNMVLHAEMMDGTFVSGESNIPKAKKRIKRVFLSPQPVQPLPEAVEAIQNADFIVIAPGSLYTSTLPNMIVPQIADAMRNTNAQVVYVCNVMTQDGETNGYSAADHIEAIEEHVGTDCVSGIIVHNRPIDLDIRKRYAVENSEPVIYDTDRLKKMGIEVIEEDIIELSKKGLLRHNTEKISKLIYQLLLKT